jgi:membrane-bound lytic murein transglycosylase D
MILHIRRNVFTAIVAFLLLVSCQLYAQTQYPEPEPLDEEQEIALSDTTDTIGQAPLDSTLLVQDIEEIITELPEDLVLDQINCLETTIPMTYNKTIKGFISYFTIRKRSFVTTMLERKHLYFPLYEEYLEKHNLPDELKYLSIVESGLNPRAVSPARAVGLWQFMSPTGRQYKLYQDSYIDERMDPYKATEAACRYLKDLYGMFGDWELALAAYNCGPGNVRRAIRRSGNKTGFWQIYNYLPRETRAYVPMFVAVNYIMTHASNYNLTTDSVARYIPADTILVNQHLDMELLAKQLDVPLEDLRSLNPQVKKNIIPKYLKDYKLRIPSEKKEFFALNRASILDSVSIVRPDVYSPQFASFDEEPSTTSRRKTVYVVRRGDVIGKIADKYKVKVTDIKKWNHLRGNNIRAGQRLAIWVNSKSANKYIAETKVQSEKSPAQAESTKTKSISAPEGKVYRVQPGDTLWRISQIHGGVPVEKIKKLNKLKSNSLKPGQKLIIG